MPPARKRPRSDDANWECVICKEEKTKDDRQYIPSRECGECETPHAMCYECTLAQCKSRPQDGIYKCGVCRRQWEISREVIQISDFETYILPVLCKSILVFKGACYHFTPSRVDNCYVKSLPPAVIEEASKRGIICTKKTRDMDTSIAKLMSRYSGTFHTKRLDEDEFILACGTPDNSTKFGIGYLHRDTGRVRFSVYVEAGGQIVLLNDHNAYPLKQLAYVLNLVDELRVDLGIKRP